MEENKQSDESQNVTSAPVCSTEDTQEVRDGPEEPSSSQVVAAAAPLPVNVVTSEKKDKEGSDSDDDDDDEDVGIETSPCGRYIKRREVVKYRDVPGVDTAYLAMDTEEGVEVVWNEAIFSGSKKFKSKEEAKLKNVFEALTLIDHPNIVKFHRYWTDDGGNFNEKSGQKDPPRLVFITEYMSSGSLKQFLKKSKKNNRKLQVQTWKRWCTQILSALNYLHATCDPPIPHGNLTCDTIFIQHNGLVKIGSVSPDIIHQNVKTRRDNIARNKHFLAPEWGSSHDVANNTAIDIYAFGVCALESQALELVPGSVHPPSSANSNGAKESTGDKAASSLQQGGNGTNGNQVAASDTEGGVVLVTEESIQKTIDCLEDEMQKDFIRKCLRKAPEDRPTARELLFHPVLFEVHSLKLLAAHILVNTPANVNETMTDEAIQTHYGRDTVMATVKRMSDGKIIEYKLSDFPVAEKLEKFMEDVKYGIYPLTAFALSQPPPPKTRAVTPSEGPNESTKSVTPEPLEPENRWGTEFKCYIGPPVPATPSQMTLVTKLCDGMNRQMQAPLNLTDTPELIATELHEQAIINWRDVPSIAKLMTMGFIQRANETAEYLANQEIQSSLNNSTADEQDLEGVNNNTTTTAAAEPTNDKQSITASVQSPAPPLSEVECATANSEPQHSSSTTVDDQEESQDILEDPTPPQKLEGKLAGLEPIIGTPQTSLGEAVSAGTTHGGLHFPRDHRFTFSGVVAENDQKLQTEIEEWQKRCLVEVANHQQTEAANAFSASITTNAAISQNGAQPQDEHNLHQEVAPVASALPSSIVSEHEENHKSTIVRSSSQQRES